MPLLNWDIEPFLPHRGRMRLVDTIRQLRKEDLSGQVIATLRADGPYFSRDRFLNHWLVEFCAQASAAISHACSRKSGEPAHYGYLVSIRQFTMMEKIALKAGDELLFDVLFETAIDPIGQSRCVVFRGDETIAEGDMTFLLNGT